MENLGDYLEAKHSEGSLDSQGVFTLDLQLALRKMAKYQSEEPALYLLKAIQLAHALGSQSIRIRADEDVTLVAALPSDPDGLRRLSDRLLGRPPFQSYPNHEERAIRYWTETVAAASQPGLQCRLAISDPDEGVLWEDVALKPFNAPGLATLTLSVRKIGAGFPLALNGTRLRQILDHRCAFCPSNLTLNGIPLSKTGPEAIGDFVLPTSGFLWRYEELELADSSQDAFSLACLAVRGANRLWVDGFHELGGHPSPLTRTHRLRGFSSKPPIIQATGEWISKESGPGLVVTAFLVAGFLLIPQTALLAGVGVLGYALLAKTASLFQLYRQNRPLPSVDFKVYPEAALQLGSHYIPDQGKYLIGGFRWRISRSIHVPYVHKGTAQILVIADGVMLNPVKLDGSPSGPRGLPPGTTVILAGSDLKVDFGGLELVTDESWASSLAEIEDRAWELWRFHSPKPC